jgi:DNA-binding beta-propeller fold protein YncE
MRKTKTNVLKVVVASAIVPLVAFLVVPSSLVYALTSPFTLMDAIGQNVGGDPSAAVNYTQWSSNNGGGSISSGGLDRPNSLALDTTHHRLFVADSANCRVLVYNLSAVNQLLDRVADNVLGTSTFDNTDPNFCSFTPSPTGMQKPSGVVYDVAHDRLFVSDENFNLVHVFDFSGGITNGMAASHVLGAPDLNTAGWGALDDKSMSEPEQMAYDPAAQNLFVTDGWFNHRVLVYNLSGGISDGMAASHVIGEPDFTTFGFTADEAGMNRPYGLAFDTVHKRLFVADILTNRVTVFDLSGGISDGMPASYVLGQPDFASYGFSATDSTMNSPLALTYDSSLDRLFVSEQFNNRVTVFDLSSGISNGMAASYVLGQNGSFTTGSCGTDTDRFCWPMQTAYDPANGNLWIADQSNSRIMIFGSTVTPPPSGGTTSGGGSTPTPTSPAKAPQLADTGQSGILPTSIALIALVITAVASVLPRPKVHYRL